MRRGKPKATWLEVVRIDLNYNPSEDLAHHGSEWRNKNFLADPNIGETRL